MVDYYLQNATSTLDTLRPGETHILRMTRTNVNGGVLLQTYVDGKPLCSYLDSPGLLTTERC